MVKVLADMSEPIDATSLVLLCTVSLDQNIFELKKYGNQYPAITFMGCLSYAISTISTVIYFFKILCFLVVKMVS